MGVLRKKRGHSSFVGVMKANTKQPLRLSPRRVDGRIHMPEGTT